MIYIDTSVLLAQLFAEDRRPPDILWSEVLITSRLAESSCGYACTPRRLARLPLLELSPLVLARALEPFPVAVRTLDALHLASLEHLRGQRLEVGLATYDERMARAARRMRVPLVDL